MTDREFHRRMTEILDSAPLAGRPTLWNPDPRAEGREVARRVNEFYEDWKKRRR